MIKLSDYEMLIAEIYFDYQSIWKQGYLPGFKPIPLNLVPLKYKDYSPNQQAPRILTVNATYNINYYNSGQTCEMSTCSKIPFGHIIGKYSPDTDRTNIQQYSDNINIFEVDIEKKHINKVYKFTPNDYYVSGASYIVAQNSDKLLYIHSIGNNGISYLRRFKKNPLSLETTLLSYNLSTYRILSNNIYPREHISGEQLFYIKSNNNHKIFKINKTNLSLNVIQNYTTGYNQKSSCSEIVNGNEVFLVVPSSGNLLAAGTFKKITINNNLSVSVSNITIQNPNGYQLTTYPGNDNFINHYLEYYKDATTGNEYLIYIQSRTKNDTNTKTHLALLKRVGTTAFEIVDVKRFDGVNNGITGHFFLNNEPKELLVSRFISVLEHYKIDFSTEKFVLINSISKPINQIGQTATGDIFIVDDKHKMSLYVPEKPLILEQNLENENITITDGTPVDTNVIVSAKNMFGDFVQTDIKLVIASKNAKFTQNNSQEITLTTSNTGPISVPIQIYDGGVLFIQGYFYVGV